MGFLDRLNYNKKKEAVRKEKLEGVVDSELVGDKVEEKKEDEKKSSLQKRIEKKVKLAKDTNLKCYKCKRESGLYKITLKKTSDGDYVCQFCGGESR